MEYDCKTAASWDIYPILLAFVFGCFSTLRILVFMDVRIAIFIYHSYTTSSICIRIRPNSKNQYSEHLNSK